LFIFSCFSFFLFFIIIKVLANSKPINAGQQLTVGYARIQVWPWWLNSGNLNTKTACYSRWIILQTVSD
jgi:hypothetical protein